MAQLVRKWAVELTAEQREELGRIVRSQKASGLVVKRARMLLLADASHPDGRHTDEAIGEILGVTRRQVQRVRVKFRQQGWSATLKRKVRSDCGIPKQIDGPAEAQLVTLCCSSPPAGRERWTLQLLADELCRLQVVARVCPETVRKTLKKIASSPGNPNASVFPSETAPGSWLRWSGCSMSTRRTLTRPIR